MHACMITPFKTKETDVRVLQVKRPPDLLQLVRPTLSPGRNDRLQNILADVGQTSKQSGPESMYQKYKKDLGDSILAFQVHKEPMQTSNLPVDIAIINDNYVKCESYLQKTYARIHRSLEPDTAASLLLQTVGVWPRRTLSDLLRVSHFNIFLPFLERYAKFSLYRSY